MNQVVGSRGFDFIDFAGICSLSGTTVEIPLHAFKDSLILREDFVDFCCDFLSYKINLGDKKDIVITWTSDSKIYDSEVYSKTVNDDFENTLKILNVFCANYLRGQADNQKESNRKDSNL